MRVVVLVLVVVSLGNKVNPKFWLGFDKIKLTAWGRVDMDDNNTIL